MQDTADDVPLSEQEGNTAVWVTGIVAFWAWLGAGWSCWDQKRGVDKTIRGALDISAIQVQQLNGSLTAHILVAAVIAIALTIPLLVALAVTVTSR